MDDALEVAEAVSRYFPSIYLRFHRRDDKRPALSNASRSVLDHLALIGPSTIGELGRHLDRSQSVVSEMITGLESQSLVERQGDPGDRRRRLIWLSPEGLAFLERDRQVLSVDLLLRAVESMPADKRRSLIDGIEALLSADDAVLTRPHLPTHPNPNRSRHEPDHQL